MFVELNYVIWVLKYSQKAPVAHKPHELFGVSPFKKRSKTFQMSFTNISFQSHV